MLKFFIVLSLIFWANFSYANSYELIIKKTTYPYYGKLYKRGFDGVLQSIETEATFNEFKLRQIATDIGAERTFVIKVEKTDSFNTPFIEEIFSEKLQNPDDLPFDCDAASKWYERLIEFILTRPDTKVRYDCNCFASYVAGISFRYGDFQLDRWVNIPWHNDLVAGQIVLIYDSEQEVKHFAVYLGDDLYISKLGLGEITVTTLDQLLQFYDSKSGHLAILKPKKEQKNWFRNFCPIL